MTQEEHTKLSRTLILESAIKEFSEKEYKLASVNHICATGSISKGRMFHHFKNKDDIFLSAAEYLFEDMKSFMDEFDYSELTSAEEALKQYFRHRQEYFIAAPQKLVFSHYISQAPPPHLSRQCNSLWKKMVEDSSVQIYNMLKNIHPKISDSDISTISKLFKVAAYYIYYYLPTLYSKEHSEVIAGMKAAIDEFDSTIHLLFHGVHYKDE